MTHPAGQGLILSAPLSGSGKTVVTLALLRALSRREGPWKGAVRGAKSGPDYIDPVFHAAACGTDCINLDAWAMSPDRLKYLAAGPGLLLIEGAMGLFDGAGLSGRGSTADLARSLGLPVILVIDAARVAHSVAPIVEGLARHDPDVRVAGVILNRTGSERHSAILKNAMRASGIRLLGSMPRQRDLVLPDRHLGLVQACEHDDLSGFLDRAAEAAAAHIDLEALVSLASHLPAPPQSLASPAPPGNRVAIAKDAAFSFAYPHLLNNWHIQGASLHTFSPLGGQKVPDSCDAVLLPGGYPELFAGELAAMREVWDSVAKAAERGATVYGECGGYMVLGKHLTDTEGVPHQMAGLLDLHTSFADRRLHLGYRQLKAAHGPFRGFWAGHEFHYATTLSARGAPLFTAWDADGRTLPDMGLRSGSVCGSFAHLIDQTAAGLPQTILAR